MVKYDIYIGCDPDVEKSGVATISDDPILLQNLAYFELYDYLRQFKDKNALVRIEAGWLNKGNWHTKNKGNSSLNAKIGSHVGANHETGRKIVEMVKYLKLNFELVRPSKTKVKSPFFKKLTGIKVSNQEQRDAYMLIHGLNK